MPLINRSVPAGIVDEASLSLMPCSSDHLYISLPTISTIGTINPVLDRTGWKIVMKKNSVCTMIRI